MKSLEIGGPAELLIASQDGINRRFAALNNLTEYWKRATIPNKYVKLAEVALDWADDLFSGVAPE